MSFWVRERRLEDGKWVPDMSEDMCLSGNRIDARALLDADMYYGAPDSEYRIRVYRRNVRKTLGDRKIVP